MFFFFILLGFCFCVPHWKIVHVTDVHGWVFGHPHNATLNADFGDFASFLEHMNANAKANGDIFLLFDTGDIIEGTGLSDATPIHGEYIFPLIKMVQNYNALTIGNHDVGHPNTVSLMKSKFIPFWNSTYLTANTLWKETNNFLGGVAYTTLKVQKYNVLVLGYLYNFTQNANNTIVVPVSTSLLYNYFKQALSLPNIDLIIGLNHIDPQTPPELSQIYTAIRALKPSIPLILLSGHRHVSYFQWFDSNAFTLESGKYFEELGIIDFDLVSGKFQNFSYQWVPTNVAVMQQMSGTSNSNFLTPKGQAIKSQISIYYNKLNLNKTYGCAPLTFFPWGHYDDPSSLYNLWIETVIPEQLYTSQVPNSFYMCNPYTLRSPIYQGRITKEDVFQVMPFGDIYYYWSPIDGDDLLNFLNEFSKWYYDADNIDPNQQYSIIVSDYDVIETGNTLNRLFPSQTWVSKLYPTNLNGDSVLSDWIQSNWPYDPSTCPSSDSTIDSRKFGFSPKC